MRREDHASDIHYSVGTVAMNAHRRKILVADCHDDSLISLEKLLEDAGFDTTTVWTAKDTLSRVDSHAFDLVLVNEYLPDAECEDLLKELQKRRVSVACIVMLPCEPEMNDFISLEKLGARDIVCKHDYRHVVEIVRECLACEKNSRAA